MCTLYFRRYFELRKFPSSKFPYELTGDQALRKLFPSHFGVKQLFCVRNCSQSGVMSAAFDDSDDGGETLSPSEYLLRSGCTAAEAGNWMEAARFFVSATMADSKNAAAYDMLSQVLLEAAAEQPATEYTTHCAGGSHTPSFQFRAVRAAESAVKLRPLEFSHLLTLGRAQLAFGEPSMALASFREAQRLAGSGDAGAAASIATDIADAERAIEWMHANLLSDASRSSALAGAMPLDGGDASSAEAAAAAPAPELSAGGAGRAAHDPAAVPFVRIPLQMIRAAPVAAAESAAASEPLSAAVAAPP